jgi:hypothetical protein
MEIVPYLSQYANLILIAITAIYATLTWMMLKEMREARKTELRPYIDLILKRFPIKSNNIGNEIKGTFNGILRALSTEMGRRHGEYGER